MTKIEEMIDSLIFLNDKIKNQKVYFLAFNQDDISLFRLLNYNINEINRIILGSDIDKTLIDKLTKIQKNIIIDFFNDHEFENNAIYLWNRSGDLRKIINKIPYKKILPFPLDFSKQEKDYYGRISNYNFANIEEYVLDIHISDHCNFSCKSCAHYAPLASKHDITVEEHEKQLKLLNKIVGLEKFGQVNILGGEPLLNADISNIVAKTREHLPTSSIVISTNGTLLKNMNDHFYQTLIDNDIIISISVYDTNIIDYEKINELLSQKQVWYCFNRTPLLINPSILPKGQENGSMAYLFCDHAKCLQLKNGKIYRCPQSAHVEYFNKYFDKNISTHEQDYFDLSDGTYNDFIDFLSSPIPFCCNCAIDTNTSSLYAPSKKSVYEWEKEDSENYNGYFIDKTRDEMGL